ncbi:MAG TPA: aspartate aminotransferase family protein [Candidatus Hydrogenedentes bacterium]|nr:aspartate aminotransferase family protein [Candidatus Hydrogenedentota bacterium]HPG70042.1 aspartate aminotransferase family protein [Candidatus Hydrogenedentota bacterium]
MNTKEIQGLNDKHIINTYGVRKLALTRGEGTRLWDAEGKEYLDFFSGIAVTNLGHCHPEVTKAICDQANKLVHVSNLYYIEPQVELAQLLCQHSAMDRWFFCNGGAEANEAGLKIARRYWAEKGTPKPGIITAEQSFHGRTMLTVTATGQSRFHKGFEPVFPGVTYVPYDDVAAIEAAITPQTGVLLLEPIQGEGGIHVPHPDYFRKVRALCDAAGVLLMFDEVQTGLGRTGVLFAQEHFGVTPDIMTLAKGLANGVPMGAMGCTENVSSGFAPGAHACTFGGNPLCSAAAVATLRALTRPRFIENAAAVGQYFADRLRTLAGKYDVIVEVRGKGLMVGVEMKQPVKDTIDKLLDAGVICGPAGPNVLRFLPPLIVTKEEVDQVVALLDTVLGTAT